MRTYDNLDIVARFQKGLEGLQIWARRIPNSQSRRQMDHVGTVLHQLLTGVFHIAARTAITGRVTNQFNVCIFVEVKRALTVPQRAQTLAARASTVTITDDNADPSNLGVHLNTSRFTVDICMNVGAHVIRS